MTLERNRRISIRSLQEVGRLEDHCLHRQQV
uniref:Uncharacterized protein n=1 Tax=Lepeophtheirus salmonis TaxID=72036 RepID=A0A0K2U1Q5_LEPSM